MKILLFPVPRSLFPLRVSVIAACNPAKAKTCTQDIGRRFRCSHKGVGGEQVDPPLLSTLKLSLN